MPRFLAYVRNMILMIQLREELGRARHPRARDTWRTARNSEHRYDGPGCLVASNLREIFRETRARKLMPDFTWNCIFARRGSHRELAARPPRNVWLVESFLSRATQIERLDWCIIDWHFADEPLVMLFTPYNATEGRPFFFSLQCKSRNVCFLSNLQPNSPIFYITYYHSNLLLQEVVEAFLI